jgi:hypothetical protein
MNALRALFGILLVMAAATQAVVKSESLPASQAGTGGPLARTAESLALHRSNADRQKPLQTTTPKLLNKDQGDVSVMEDDGTLIIPLNRFDLSDRSLTFTPERFGYTVQTGTSAFDSGQGVAVVAALGDDDSVNIVLPFAFPFYGMNYSSVFLNTDGNLTFLTADSVSTARNLRRVMSGPPRISPLFDDFLPSSTGTVTVESISNRVIFNWTTIREYGTNLRSTFQVVLKSDGVIQFNYRTVNVNSAVVGLAPGETSSVRLTNFSGETQLTASAGVIAEVFSNAELLDLVAIGQTFYAAHPDSYDQLIVFSDFDLDLQDAFAYAIPIRNQIQGIMPPDWIYDVGAQFGSAARLAAMVNGGSIHQYPADPQQEFLGTNNTLDILGQEFGHRWLAFIDTNPSTMLGRDSAHWSFFMNSAGSVMEGNEIEDLGNGRFKTVAATYRYSPLDQYMMGLRAASEVPPWFIVTNPRFDSGPSDFRCLPLNASCPPAVGVEMSGTRRNMAIEEVISIAGPRIPASDAQKEFSAAFILVTKQGQDANPKSVAQLDTIRQQWEQFFLQAVEGRGTMKTRLEYHSITELQIPLPTNGSAGIETAASPSLRVGYGAMESAVGVAVLRSFSGRDLVSEAAVPATQAATRWIVYVENGSRALTGIAIANPDSSPANLTFSLSDGRQTTLQIPAGGQHAAFVDRLFGNLQSYLGSLTIESDTSVAVLALRGTSSAGRFIIATVPLTSMTPALGGETVFPIVAAGGSYATELILVNSGRTPSNGNIVFPSVTYTDAGGGTRFPFSIAAGGVWKLRLLNSSSSVKTSYATLSADAGSPTPVATAMIQFSDEGELVSETAIPAQGLVSRSLLFVSYGSSVRTGLSILNPSSQNNQVTLTARDRNGNVVSSKTISLGAHQYTSSFLNELLTDLPVGHQGTVVVTSTQPVYMISLRGTNLPDGGFLIAGLPTIDLDRLVPGIAYFPHIATGGTFTTEFLIANIAATTAQLSFTDPNGAPLEVTLK